MISVRDDLDRRLKAIDAGVGPHVFTRVYRQEAIAAAEAADARRRAGVSLGPLDGAIVSIKDLFDVAGEPTTAGSVLLKNAPPAIADAVVIRRLRRAGAVIVGKTNMSEFAFSGVGLNPHYGTPGNAADSTRIPGGSTAGGGVSVAQGTSDIAIGSDTGGSVRIPSSLNGIVGFKPTARRIPLDGVFPLSYSLDSVGPLALTVEACNAADAVLAGEEYRPLQPAPVAGLRLGVPRGLLFKDTEPLVAEAFETCLKRLSDGHARIEEHGIEDLLADIYETIAPAPFPSIEASEIHADWLDARAAEFDPRVRVRIERGRSVSASVYIRMLHRRAALIEAFDRRLRDIDVLVLPTTPASAVPIAVLDDDAEFSRVNLLMLRNCTVANLFDLTAVSLPMPGTVRPSGLMLIARHGHDRRLLEIAAGVEALLATDTGKHRVVAG